jgi:hypothetical protein
MNRDIDDRSRRIPRQNGVADTAAYDCLPGGAIARRIDREAGVIRMT